MQFDDRELLERAKAHPENFEPLYTKYTGRIYNYFWFRVGFQKELAEDCMQETFLRAYKHLSGFTDKGISYFSYLLTIAHNLLVNYYRQNENTKTVSLDDVDVAVFDSLEIGSEQQERSNALWTAVASLSQGEREILMLRYQKDLPIKDIAAQLGKSENAVKLVISRAKKKLQHHPSIILLTAAQQSE
mgnify:FL=1